jgi:hypothetical protein
MHKRWTSYTLFSLIYSIECLFYQRCIKSCIKEKKRTSSNPWGVRVLFFDVFRKEVLCQLVLYILYSLKREKLPECVKGVFLCEYI